MTGYNLVELTTMDTYHDLEVCIYVVSYLPPHCKKKKKKKGILVRMKKKTIASSKFLLIITLHMQLNPVFLVN